MRNRKRFLMVGMLLLIATLTGCGNMELLEYLTSESEEVSDEEVGIEAQTEVIEEIESPEEIVEVVVEDKAGIWDIVDIDMIVELYEETETLDDSVWGVGQGITTETQQASSTSSSTSSTSSSSSSTSSTTEKFILNPVLKACVQGTNATVKSKLTGYSIEAYMGTQGVPFIGYIDYSNQYTCSVRLTDTTGYAYNDWSEANGGTGSSTNYNCFSDSYQVGNIQVTGTNCLDVVFQAQVNNIEFTTEFLSYELGQQQDGSYVDVFVDNGVDTIQYLVFQYSVDGCHVDLYYLDEATPAYINVYYW